MQLQPSQYDVNCMQQGDFLHIVKRGVVYRFIRFLIYKITHTTPVYLKYNNSIYNQEDCILVRKAELLCIQTYNNVKCTVLKGLFSKKQTTDVIKKITVTLYNINLTFRNNNVISIPINLIQKGIRENTQILDTLEKQNIISDECKRLNVQSKYYESYVKENDIKRWKPIFCQCCGRPVVFEFQLNGVDIKNTCKCGYIHDMSKYISYQELALWINSQSDKNIKQAYYKFWHR